MHLKQHAKYKLVEKKKSINMMGFVDSSMGHQSNKTSSFSASNFTENISLQRALLKKQNKNPFQPFSTPLTEANVVSTGDRTSHFSPSIIIQGVTCRLCGSAAGDGWINLYFKKQNRNENTHGISLAKQLLAHSVIFSPWAKQNMLLWEEWEPVIRLTVTTGKNKSEICIFEKPAGCKKKFYFNPHILIFILRSSVFYAQRGTNHPPVLMLWVIETYCQYFSNVKLQWHTASMYPL